MRNFISLERLLFFFFLPEIVFREQAVGWFLVSSGCLSNPEWLTACTTDHLPSTDPLMSAEISVHAAHRQHCPAEVKSKAEWDVHIVPTEEHMGTQAKQHHRCRAPFLLAHVCQWGKNNQPIMCVKYSILIPAFYLLDQRDRCVHHFQLACSLLLEFMLPNKTTVKETNESPLTPLHVSAAEPKAGLQHPLTACLLKWKRVLVLQLGAATWTYFSLRICFQTTVHFFVGVFVEKIKQALFRWSYKSPSECLFHSSLECCL